MREAERELLRRIRLPEDSFVEFKEVRFRGRKVSAPHADSMANTLAAFANGRGGTCVIGVEDKAREVVGIPLERVADVEDWLSRICTDRIDPPLAPGIEVMTLPSFAGEDVPVIRVSVPRSLFAPHQTAGGFLQRVGSSKRRMTRDEVARVIQERSQTGLLRFDEQIVHGATLSDLAEPLWARLKTVRTRDDAPTLLRKLRIARADGDGVPRPTVAGVLISASNPQHWFPHAFIQAVHYRGTDVRTGGTPHQIDAADIGGTLDAQVEAACRFIARNMTVAARKRVGRVDLPQYDIGAVFEALVNAVAHRDYSLHGSHIRLRMFSDRIEVHSPGSLPNGMTIDALPHIQSSRNGVLTSLLAKIPVPDDVPWLETNRETLMDKRGEGVRVIFERSERVSGQIPTYELFADRELKLTITGRKQERRLNGRCPIWGTEAEVRLASDVDAYHVYSPRAGGYYDISGQARVTLEPRGLSESDRRRLGEWIAAERLKGKSAPVVTTDVLEAVAGTGRDWD